MKQSHGLAQRQGNRLDPTQIFKQRLLACTNIELPNLVRESIELNVFVESIESNVKLESLEQMMEAEAAFDEVRDSISESYIEEKVSKMDGDGTLLPNIPEDRNGLLVDKHTVIDDLVTQINTLPLEEFEKKIGEYFARSINDDGFIPQTEEVIETVSGYVDLPADQVRDLLKRLQFSLQPAGVLSTGPQESLLIQARLIKDKQESVIAESIFKDHYPQFLNRNYDAISKSLRINNPLLLESVFDRIKQFSPTPVRSEVPIKYRNLHKAADFTIHQKGDYYFVKATGSAVPEIHLNSGMVKKFDRLHHMGKTQDPEYLFLKDEMQRINEIKVMLQERVGVLEKVISFTLNQQSEFMKSGDPDKLSPLLMNQVAERFNLDPSTVSRISNEKVLQRENGELLTLRNLFILGVKNSEGNRIAYGDVKETIRELVRNENKKEPLSDLQLEERMKEKGIEISFNRINLFRKSMDIPSAKERKANASITPDLKEVNINREQDNSVTQSISQ